MILYDSQGTPLRIGARVVYNQSGYLSVGYIQGFTKPSKANRAYVKGRLEPQPYILIDAQNGLSKVRDPRSIVVIHPQCHCCKLES